MARRRPLTMLVQPGYKNSGPQHWQSVWETNFASLFPRSYEIRAARRVNHSSFDACEASEWSRELETHLAREIEEEEEEERDVLLCAHSLGVLNTVHTLDRLKREGREEILRRVRGTFLVAPPNPDREDFPRDTVKGFEAYPRNKIPVPSMLIYSTNDPYGDVKFCESLGEAWGCRHVLNVGPKGHINSDSRLGEWDEGIVALERLLGIDERP